MITRGLAGQWPPPSGSLPVPPGLRSLLLPGKPRLLRHRILALSLRALFPPQAPSGALPSLQPRRCPQSPAVSLLSCRCSPNWPSTEPLHHPQDWFSPGQDTHCLLSASPSEDGGPSQTCLHAHPNALHAPRQPVPRAGRRLPCLTHWPASVRGHSVLAQPHTEGLLPPWLCKATRMGSASSLTEGFPANQGQGWSTWSQKFLLQDPPCEYMCVREKEWACGNTQNGR